MQANIERWRLCLTTLSLKSLKQNIINITEPLNVDVGDVGSRGKMTGTDKMALNSLYDCETVSSKVIMQFLREENTRLSREIKQLKTEDSRLTNDIRPLKMFSYQCAYKNHWTAGNSIITYDTLTISSMSGVAGGLNIKTGVFTAGLSGVWSVSYSLKSRQYSGDEASLYLNGDHLVESSHDTFHSGEVRSLGGRTLYMRLQSGDSLTLGTGSVRNGGLYQITLCFEFSRPDDD